MAGMWVDMSENCLVDHSVMQMAPQMDATWAVGKVALTENWMVVLMVANSAAKMVDEMDVQVAALTAD